MTKVVVTATGALALLAGVGWLGYASSPNPSRRTRRERASRIRSNYRQICRSRYDGTSGVRWAEVPRIETAVVWGKGYFNLKGLWFPMRFKSYNVAGREFRRDMELTWFGMPIFWGYDAYLGGKGSLEFTGLLGLVNVSDSGEKFDQGDNLAMWAEALFTTPSVLLLDPRVRWEPIDATSARLIVPFGEQEEESLRVEFDPETSLMTRMSGMRFRDHEESKTPWHGESSE